MLKRDQYYDRLLVVNGIPLTILALQAYPSYTATERYVPRLDPTAWPPRNCATMLSGTVLAADARGSTARLRVG